MTELRAFFNEIPTLLILVLVGFILYKGRLIGSEAIKGFSGTLIYVAMPLLILDSFTKNLDRDILRDFSEAILISAAVYAFQILIATAVMKRNKSDEAVIIKLSLSFSNCAFLGIPVAASLFGGEGVVFASIYNLFFNILLWTYAVKIIHGDVKLRKGAIRLFLNPGILSVIIGLGLILSGLTLPSVIEKPVGMIGSLTTPLAMIIIGALFAQKPMKSVFRTGKIYLISLARLILIPVSLIFIFSAAGFSGTHIEVIVILAAMPVATTIAILAEQYDKAPVFASGVVMHSTLASLFTIPLIYYLLNIVF